MSSTSPAVLYDLMEVLYLGPISMLHTIPLQTGCGSLQSSGCGPKCLCLGKSCLKLLFPVWNWNEIGMG